MGIFRDKLPTDVDWHAFMCTIGDELRTIRKQRDWTRKQLAEYLPEPVSEPTLGTYEWGTRNMYVLRFVHICWALEQDPCDILKRTFERLKLGTGPGGLVVDLNAASRLERADLAPLRGWAAAHLRTLPSGTPKAMRLTESSLEALGNLCGLDVLELAKILPKATRRSGERVDSG
jgi:transcriptional regulator with XRE-family HTH domain